VAHRYPEGTVRNLLRTDHVSDATRAALTERLALPTVNAPDFFTASEFTALRAVCDRLMPQADRADPIDLAGVIDRRLASGQGNGWRYDTVPPDGEMYRLFLSGLHAVARELDGVPFAELDNHAQDEILSAVQNGETVLPVWSDVSSARCFEEILAEVAETYYAHPLAQEEIGYAGMADLPGWSRIGLNEREPREPHSDTPS